MIDPQEILASYTTLISGPSTKSIKEAQQRLKQLCEVPAFLEINKAILLEHQLSRKCHKDAVSIKKMSIVHLAIFLKKNKRNNNVALDVIAKEYLELLCHDKMEHSLKPLLLIQLEEMLCEENNQVLRTAIMNKLKQDLENNKANFMEVVYIGQALIGLKAGAKDVKNFMLATFERYNTLATQLHGEVPKIIEKQTLINILRLIGEYSRLIKSFIARIGLMDSQTSKLLYSSHLVETVKTAFEVTVPGNSFAAHIYFHIPQQNQVSSLLNAFKKNYISILAAFMRIVAGSPKNSPNLTTNLLYMQSTFILDYVIQATIDLLQNQMYHQLSGKSLLVPCLFQSMGLIITALRNNDFYQTFRKYRTDIIQKILIPCLCFSPADIQQFYENHAQFVEKVLHIVDKQLNSQKKRKNKDNEDIELFDTLKTYAGECISVLCKFQDQVLAEIFEFTMNVLEGKVGCPYPKTVFLLLITLLKPRLINRKDFETRLAIFLTTVLKETQPPQISQQNKKQEDIEYGLLLLSVSRYVPDLGDINTQILPISIQRGVSILSGGGNQIYKMLIFQFFDEMNRLQNGQDYALDLLNLYNTLLQKDPSNRLLDSYYQLLQFNLQFFQGYVPILLKGIFIICKHVEQQLKRPNPNQLFLNKCLNAVREIGENELYLPKVIPELEQALLPLLPYIDGRQGIDLQQDILLMLTAFLKYGKAVTLAQQQMFSIIPKIFYNQYHCTFGQAFSTVHNFIYYGANVLANAPQAIQAIIQMSLASIFTKEYKGQTLSQTDNCEGVLILQSLLLACGSFLTKDTWILLLQKIVGKLHMPISSVRLIANILGLLSLCLVQTQHIFTDQQNVGLLTPVLNGANKCAKVKWGQKVIIAGLTELMVNFQKPFVKNNFSSILETVLILLQSSTVKLNSTKEAIIDSFDDKEDDEEFDYDNLIQMTNNNLKQLDEFAFFKLQFAKMHSTYKEYLIQIIEKMPPNRKDFLNRILTTQKVANTPRRIFQIKKG